MCLICRDLDHLTAEEAMRNIGEALISTSDPEKTKHLIDLSDRIMDKEVPMTETDVDTDQRWWDETYNDQEE